MRYEPDGGALAPAIPNVPPLGQRLRWVAAIAVGIAIVCCGVFAYVNHNEYGTWTPWSAPTRIKYAGADFRAVGTVTGAPAAILAGESGSPVWTKIGSTLWGEAIYAGLEKVGGRVGLDTAHIYVRLGGARYRAYTP